MNTGFEHSTTSKFSERFDKTESDGSSQDTPTSKNVNEMPWNLAWPKCDLEAPHVIYAAANPVNYFACASAFFIELELTIDAYA